MCQLQVRAEMAFGAPGAKRAASRPKTVNRPKRLRIPSEESDHLCRTNASFGASNGKTATSNDVMKICRALAFSVIGMTALATGCVEPQVVYGPVPPPPPPGAVVVAQAPPPPPPEVVPVAPSPGYVWTPGYWSWGVSGWVWIGGVWVVRPHPRAVWVGGHWYRHGHGYIWVGGHWR